VIHGVDTGFLVAVEVSCHPDHAAARFVGSGLRKNGDLFALAPQVLAEFVHVVTDARRFSAPLAMPRALERAKAWWSARDVIRLAPEDRAVAWSLDALSQHQLGRKRILDTLLAGTLRSAGVFSVLTLNPDDFATFGEFTSVALASGSGSP
jgi:predicted nucleic acid-binding protein